MGKKEGTYDKTMKALQQRKKKKQEEILGGGVATVTKCKRFDGQMHIVEK